MTNTRKAGVQFFRQTNEFRQGGLQKTGLLGYVSCQRGADFSTKSPLPPLDSAGWVTMISEELVHFVAIFHLDLMFTHHASKIPPRIEAKQQLSGLRMRDYGLVLTNVSCVWHMAGHAHLSSLKPAPSGEYMYSHRCSIYRLAQGLRVFNLRLVVQLKPFNP